MAAYSGSTLLTLDLPQVSCFPGPSSSPMQEWSNSDFLLTPNTSQLIQDVRSRELIGFFEEEDASRSVINHQRFTLVFPTENEQALGAGSYKIVYVGAILNAEDRLQRVAIAKPRDGANSISFTREAERLRAIQADHLLKNVITISLDEIEWSVEPFYEGGTFEDYVLTHYHDVNYLETALEYFKKVAEDLEQRFHAHGLLHRDIKLANILVSGETVTLNDFDFVIREGDYSFHPFAGTRGFLDPNIRNPNSSSYGKPSKATDIYALGITLKLLIGAFEHSNPELYESIKTHLVEPMTCDNPQARLSVDQVILGMEEILSQLYFINLLKINSKDINQPMDEAILMSWSGLLPPPILNPSCMIEC